MFTFADLSAEMVASGRPLARRKARDWWAKGLLPRPKRRGICRGKGTETFWLNRRVLQQAQAVHDLPLRHLRVDTAIVGIWLLGFPVEAGHIRAAYGRLIRRHRRSVWGHQRRQCDEIIGEIAERISRNLVKKGAPNDATNALTDLVLKFLETFYGTDLVLEDNDLATLWKRAEPHLIVSSTSSTGNPDLKDHNVGFLLQYLMQWASLSAQRHAIASASDYEILRARRLVLLGLSCLRRLCRAAPTPSNPELDDVRPLLFMYGRLAVPILITVLRDRSLKSQIVQSLLRMPTMIRDNSHLFKDNDHFEMIIS